MTFDLDAVRTRDECDMTINACRGTQMNDAGIASVQRLSQENARLREELAAMQAAEIVAWCVEWHEDGKFQRETYAIDDWESPTKTKDRADDCQCQYKGAIVYPLTRGGPNV